MANNYKSFDVKITLFGDDLVKYLVVNDAYLDTELYSKNMTINDLITKLLSTTTNEDVDHVFFSIGKMDRFKLTNNISLDYVSYRPYDVIYILFDMLQSAIQQFF